ENFVALTGAVAGVDQNREMAAPLDGRNDGEVERVARKVREGADAAFAEHHVVVAFGEDVLGGHKEFVERGGHAAFEEHGLFAAAGAFEEGKILHVARADLDTVGVFFNEVEGFVVDGFGNDAESEFVADFCEDLQAGLAESLEAVWGSARFVSATAEEANAGGLELRGD